MKEPAIGVKLNHEMSSLYVQATMVFLNELSAQWPWRNPVMASANDLADKEIYTHRVAFEDASDLWRVPIYDPLPGFAFTGMRITIVGKDETYTVVPRLVVGGTEKPMFGLPWDQSVANNKTWTPLGFPLTNKIIAICEDGLDLLMKHPSACWGQVEFVAQRFDDLMEDEKEMTYMFMNHRTDKVEWILTADNRMYRPQLPNEPVYRGKVKLIPSVLRLLDEKRNPWQDTSFFWNQVNLGVPLLQ